MITDFNFRVWSCATNSELTWCRIDARTNKAITIGQSSLPILDWVNEDLLGKNRVSFDTQLSPASLKVKP